MIAIKNYNDTKYELEIAKKELERLLEKKEELYSKYFCTTAKYPATEYRYNKKTDKYEYVLKDENAGIKGKRTSQDKVSEYLTVLYSTDDENELSLEEQIQQQKNIVSRLEYYLKLMEENMGKLEGTEYKLYYALVIDKKNINKSISKIIEEFAENNYMHTQTIWQNYYPKIKKYIDKLKIYSENIVE